MKPISFLLPLLLLAVAGASARAPAAVIDVDGHPVTTGSTYYITPVKRGNGGGLSLGQRNASFDCPLYVTQEKREFSGGLPVKFHPVNPKAKIVRVSTDMNVVFDASTVCVQSTAWKLSDVEGPTEQLKRYVKSGGELGSPGIGTLSNWFKIEKDEDSKANFYKLVFCPGVCNFCKVVCGDLGLFIEKDGKRFLGLAPQIKPFLVMFKKA